MSDASASIKFDADASKAVSEVKRMQTTIKQILNAMEVDFEDMSKEERRAFNETLKRVQQGWKEEERDYKATKKAEEKAAEEAAKKMQKEAEAVAKAHKQAYDETKQHLFSWGDSVNRWIMNFGVSVLNRALSTAVQGIKNFAIEGFNLQAEIESVTVALDTLSKAGAGTDEVLKQIRKDAIETPFDVSSLAKATQRFTMITENAEEAEKTVMNFGKVLAAAGKGSTEMSRIATNMQQIGNEARISQRDFNEFATAGVNMTKLVAKSAGIAETEVMTYLKRYQEGVKSGMTEAQLLAKGIQKPYDILVKAINDATEAGGEFANVFEDLAGTLPQVLNNMRESVAGGFADIFSQSGLEKEVKKAAVAIGEAFAGSDLTENATKALTHILDLLKEITGFSSAEGVVTAVLGKVSSFLEKLAAGQYDKTIRNIVDAVKTFLQTQAQFNPLMFILRELLKLLNDLPEGAGEVVGRIAGLVVVFGSFAGVAGKVVGAVDNVTTALKGLPVVGNLVTSIFSKIFSHGSKVTGTMGQVAEKTTQASEALGTKLGRAFENVATGLTNFTHGLTELVKAIGSFVSETLSSLLEAVTNVAKALGDFAVNTISQVITWVGKLGSAILDLAGKLSTHLFNALNKVAKGIMKVVQTVAGGAGKALRAFFEPLADPKLLLGVIAFAGAAGGLFILAQALIAFNDVNWESLAKAGVAMVGIGAIAALAGTIAPLLGIGAAVLVGLGAAMAAIGGGLMVLAGGIGALNGIGGTDLSSLISTFEQLAVIGGILALSTFSNLLGAISGGALLVMVNEIKGIAEVLNSVPEIKDLSSLQKGMLQVSDMAESLAWDALQNFAGMVSGDFLLNVAEDLRDIAEALDSIPQINSENISSLRNALEVMRDIPLGNALFNGLGLAAVTPLTPISRELANIAGELETIPKIGTENIEALKSAIEKMREIPLGNALFNGLGAAAVGPLVDVAKHMAEVAQALSSIPNVDGGQIEQLSGVISQLSHLNIEGVFATWDKALATGNLIKVAENIISVANALGSIPQIDMNRLDKVREAMTKVANLNIEGFFAANDKAGATEKLEKVVAHMSSIAWKILELPSNVGTDSIEKIKNAVNKFKEFDWSALNKAASLAATAQSAKNFMDRLCDVAWAMINAQGKFSEINAGAIDNGLQEIGKILDYVNNTMQSPNLDKVNAIKDFFNALNEALNPDTISRINNAVTLLQKTNFATLQSDMEHITQAFNIEFPDVSGMVNFFDQVNWALDADVLPSMEKLFKLFTDYNEERVNQIVKSATAFVNFVDGKTEASWNQDAATNFMLFFDRVGWALDNDVAPNLQKMLEVFEKFSGPEQMQKITECATNFVNFVQGTFVGNEGASWDESAANNFMLFFDRVGWALDNDVAPNLQKMLEVFEKFAGPEQMTKITEAASNFVSFVQGKQFADEGRWNQTTADNFMQFFDRVGWALDNDVAPNLQKMLEVFQKFDATALETILNSASNFVDFVAGKGSFAEKAGETPWDTGKADAFMQFFDRVGWALDNGVLGAIESLITTFSKEWTTQVFPNAAHFVDFVKGNFEGKESAWNATDADTFRAYFDNIHLALDENVVPAIDAMITTFSRDGFDKVQTNLNTFVTAVNTPSYSSGKSGALAGFMTKFEEYTGTWESVTRFMNTFANLPGEEAKTGAGAFSEVVNTVSGSITKLIEAVKGYDADFSQIGANFASKIAEGWGTTASNITSTAQGTISEVIGALNNVVGQFREVGNKYIQNVIDGWNDRKGLWRDTVKSAMVDGLNMIKTYYNSFSAEGGTLVNRMTHEWTTHDWSSHGRNACEGIITGISTYTGIGGRLYNKGREIASNVLQGVKDRSDEGSPWGTTIQSGRWAAMGLLLGIDDMLPDVTEAGASIAEALLSGYRDMIEPLTVETDFPDFSEGGAGAQYGTVGAGAKNITITNNNSISSGLDIATVSGDLAWQISHAL